MFGAIASSQTDCLDSFIASVSLVGGGKWGTSPVAPGNHVQLFHVSQVCHYLNRWLLNYFEILDNGPYTI